MQSVPSSINQPGQRPVPDALPALQCAAGCVSAAIAPASRADAGSDSARQVTTWPGRDFGVRQPYPGETPLSWEEVWLVLRDEGLPQ